MRPRLATKFLWTIGIVGLSILSSLVALYGAWRVDTRLEEATRENVPTVRPEEVRIMIRERNGLMASYLLDDGKSAWIDRLHALKPQFQNWIATVRRTTQVPDEEQALLLRLEKMWTALDVQQEELIDLFKKGEATQAKKLVLEEMTGGISKQADDVSKELIATIDHYVLGIMERAEARVRVTTWVVGVSGALSLSLGGFLLWLFYYRVLLPLRGMVADARMFRGDRSDHSNDSDIDELRIMGNHLRNLMSDVSDTRSRLELSRDRLMAAEKLASLGKLAASVAHEIRNPLTAIKMWLFSIREAAEGNAELDRKLRIVSEEISRLESIVRDLLEFSRPPALHRQPHFVHEMIDHTLELLSPRLIERGIHVQLPIDGVLPPVIADASQFRQVLLNLFENAVDAMPAGGEIRITTTVENDASGQSMVVVRISDSGQGMPQGIQRRVFEPFFTTKESGTGLGLCIAAQVMARHGGALVLESSTDKGTSFAVWMPIAQEGDNGQNPRC